MTQEEKITKWFVNHPTENRVFLLYREGVEDTEYFTTNGKIAKSWADKNPTEIKLKEINRVEAFAGQVAVDDIMTRYNNLSQYDQDTAFQAILIARSKQQKDQKIMDSWESTRTFTPQSTDNERREGIT